MYYAPRQYLTDNTAWPTAAISLDTSYEARRQALLTGPYGRCVYHCDNDVCDHQTVSLEFEQDITLSFTANAFTQTIDRSIQLTGTKGSIQGEMEKGLIRYREFGTGREDVIQLNLGADNLGHGGGDVRLMRDFVEMVQNGGKAKTLAQDALASHLIAFAAEKSRLGGITVPLVER